MIYPNSLRSVTLCVAGSIILADFLIYGHALGWALAPYLLGLLGLLWLQMPNHQRKDRRTQIASAGIVGLALALMWNPDSLSISLSLLGLALIGMATRSSWEGNLLTWLRRLITFFTTGWAQFWLDSTLLRRWRDSGHRTKAILQLDRLGKQWTIPIMITGLFLILFTIANPLVSNWVSQSLRMMLNPLMHLEWPPFTRIVFWSAILLFTWALLRYRPKHTHPAAKQSDGSRTLDLTSVDTVVRSLILLNLLFAVMNVLDLRYLWAGATLPNGMSYAEYAQRGAYPLVISALLAGFFVLITFRSGGSSEKSHIALVLVSGWVAQNIFLTISAGWRLGIYIDVYSLTRLRMAAAIWIALVACGLVWICLRILQKKSNDWLIQRNAITLGCVLYICAFINFDGYIARYNIERCQEVTGQGTDLDWAYLKELGIEALPALRALKTTEGMSPEFRQSKQQLESTLEHQLKQELSDWQSWTWLRAQLNE